MLTKFSFWRKVPVWMRGLPIASGIAVASLVLIYQPVKIEGNSMTPLLSNHEAIIINRLVYHFEPIRRGDVIVFRYPLDATKSYIKRIVSLPGETVQIRQGLVYVNGSWIPEPYVLSQYEDLSDFGPIQVWAAFSGTMPRQEEVLYYTNDRIHWFRRLSEALQLEIDRLALTRTGGLPRIN